MNESESKLPLLKKPKTAAGILKFELETKFLPVLAQNPHADIGYKRMRQLALMLDPWPVWALRVASDVIVVYFPRIKRQNIFVALKTIHWFLFEAEMEGDLDSSMQIKSELPESELPPEFTSEIVSFLAHIQRHAEIFKTKLEESKARAKVWSEQDENNLAHLKKGYQEIGQAFIKLLSNEPPENLLSLMDLFVAAYKATYDGQGNIRETTATKVYNHILKSWPQIQKFSDAKELCKFLDPVLGHGDTEMKLDRVKKIVRRMGIKFRPNCQGTSP